MRVLHETEWLATRARPQDRDLVLDAADVIDRAFQRWWTSTHLTVDGLDPPRRHVTRAADGAGRSVA
jgi:hypothetical protein